jgi:hypothetical protein
MILRHDPRWSEPRHRRGKSGDQLAGIVCARHRYEPADAGAPTMTPASAGPAEAPLAPRESCVLPREPVGPHHGRDDRAPVSRQVPSEPPPRGGPARMRPISDGPAEAPLAPREAWLLQRRTPGPRQLAAEPRPHRRAPATVKPTSAETTEAPLAPREPCLLEREPAGLHHERARRRTPASRQVWPRHCPRPHWRSDRTEAGGLRGSLPGGNHPIRACDPIHREGLARAEAGSGPMAARRTAGRPG